MTIEKQISQLREKINNCNYHYYILDNPIATDAEYDSMFSQLRELEEKHPQFITSDSPTQRVGVEPSTEFQKLLIKFLC